MPNNEVCQKDERRQLVRTHKSPQGLPDRNGIDFVEVSDCQRKVTLYFLSKAPRLEPKNAVISGGRRVPEVPVTKVTGVRQQDRDLDDCLTLHVDNPGDFSGYTLRLVEADKYGNPTRTPLHGLDPRYAQIRFSFKAGCPSPLDCAESHACPPAPLPKAEINYLAKDYASFRQLLLDRLSVTLPDWRERHVPDLGITLVEILAYTADHLSYFQDAVATEAYLDTARQRISVRRHARLVDYVMHEGCNARAWVTIRVSQDTTLPAGGVQFLAVREGRLEREARQLTRVQLQQLGIPEGEYEVYEPMTPAPLRLHEAHNEIAFYTWGGFECCLPKGATRATLDDQPAAQAVPAQPRRLSLQPGDVLVFEEIVSPTTGERGDADPGHRHAVLLTSVQPAVDPLNGRAVLEIEWAADDALPFQLCISAISDAPDCERLDRVSVARGNIVLVDHGRTIGPEYLGRVPTRETAAECSCSSCVGEVTPPAGRFRPRLGRNPLTHAQLLPQPRPTDGPCRPPALSATMLLSQEVARASPQAWLTSTLPSGEKTAWESRGDLLASSATEAHFVAEIANDFRAELRFGDDAAGRRPRAEEGFTAHYRVGNGRDGNAGAEAITHLLLRDTLSGVMLEPRNPLPAVGGVEPESMEDVRLFAPHAFRRQRQRAVTAEDYAALASRHPKIQRATARLISRGAWVEVNLAVDPLGGTELDTRLRDEIACLLRPFRRIGHEVRVVAARYAALNIEMSIRVLEGYLRGHVEAELRQIFGSGTLPDGRLGFFHPDRLTFGQSILMSQLVATAHTVTGVENARVTQLQRLHEGPVRELTDGLLVIGPGEIALAESNPAIPENGQISFAMGGGR